MNGTRRVLTAIVVLICASSLAYPAHNNQPATAATLGSKTCKVVRKHGKRTRVCRRTAPPPTPTASPAAGLFGFPTGIAVDGANNVYVADAERGHVVKLSPDGKLMATIGTKGSQPGQMLQPWGLALDTQGNLYISDTPGIVVDQRFRDGPRRVQKLSPTGRPLAQFSAQAMGIDVPCGMALDARGNLYVADFGGGQVVELGPDGHQVRRISTVDPWPCGIALDSTGSMYLSQGMTEDVGKYSPDGKRVATLGSPGTVDPGFGVAVDGSDNLVAIRFESSQILRFSSTGRLLTTWGAAGTAPGAFRFDKRHFLGLATDQAGNVYVPDQGNHRIQKFSPSGQLLAVWK